MLDLGLQDQMQIRRVDIAISKYGIPRQSCKRRHDAGLACPTFAAYDH
jgi:hypothetical protein